MVAKAPSLKILPLGGCLLRPPLSAYCAAHVRVVPPIGVWAGANYTLGEMIQVVRMMRGEVTLPSDLLALADFLQFAPPASRDLTGFDVVLAEPNSLDEVHYGPYVLERTSINRRILKSLVTARPGPEVRAMALDWFQKGIFARDEAVRADLGPKLAALVPGDLPAAELYRDVLTNARGFLREVMQGVRELRALIDIPMALVTFTFQYTPNGRPIHWPARFREDILKAGEALDLPVFEPWRVVQKFGVANVMKPDLRIYQRPFHLPLGEAMVEFAQSVVDGARQASENAPARAAVT